MPLRLCVQTKRSAFVRCRISASLCTQLHTGNFLKQGDTGDTTPMYKGRDSPCSSDAKPPPCARPPLEGDSPKGGKNQCVLWHTETDACFFRGKRARYRKKVVSFLYKWETNCLANVTKSVGALELATQVSIHDHLAISVFTLILSSSSSKL